VSVGEGLGEFERTSRPEFTGVAVVRLLGGTVGVSAESTSKSVVGAIVGAGFGTNERASKSGFVDGAAVGSSKSGGAVHSQLHSDGFVAGPATGDVP
jgi:hypothetical protein